MEGKKTTQEEYQKCVNAVVDYINLHLGEEIDLKSLARISHFSPFYFHRIMKAFWVNPSVPLLSGHELKQRHAYYVIHQLPYPILPIGSDMLLHRLFPKYSNKCMVSLQQNIVIIKTM